MCDGVWVVRVYEGGEGEFGEVGGEDVEGEVSDWGSSRRK